MKRTSTGTYLDRILADTSAQLAGRRDLPDAPPVVIPPARGFGAALGISLIAEIKKASPSRGIIRTAFDPPAIAHAYEAAGAAAISVLTDTPYFQGSLADLDAARAATTLPLLRKDFLIHPAQIFETVGRADAVLLIVAALTPRKLGEFLQLAAVCGLDALVEVHDRAEVETALACGAHLIGINNRDLRTFTVDLQTTLDLLDAIPGDRIIVSESGIGTPAQVRMLAEAGVDAMLVGERLMVSADLENAVRTLLTGATPGDFSAS